MADLFTQDELANSVSRVESRYLDSNEEGGVAGMGSKKMSMGADGFGTRTTLGGGWVAPDMAKARAFFKSLLFEQGASPVWRTPLSHLSILGPGITLHFRMLVYLSIFFVVASLVALPTLIVAKAGTRLSMQDVDPSHMSLLSIANVGQLGMAQANYTLNLGPNGRYGRYTGRQLALIFSGTDVAYSILFFLFVGFLRSRIRHVESVDHQHLSAADYAVFVTGLPGDATEAEVRDHFSRLYDLRSPDWTYTSSCLRCCWAGRKVRRRRQFADSATAPPVEDGSSERFRNGFVRTLDDADVYPVKDARNSGNKGYLRSWVAEVSLATRNGTLIKKYQSISSLLQRVRTAKAKVKKFSSGSAFEDDKKRAAALKRLAAVEARLNKAHTKHAASYSSECVGAFVVFNNEESRRRCLEDYGASGTWYHPEAWAQAPALRFRGTAKLEVGAAPDPSQIVWQNLELSLGRRLALRLGVNMLVVALLVVSFLFIIFAQAQQQKFQSEIPQLNVCDTILPSVAFKQPVAADGSLAPGANLPPSLKLTRVRWDKACATAASVLRSNSSTNGAEHAYASLIAPEVTSWDRFQWSSPLLTASGSAGGAFPPLATSLFSDDPCLSECLPSATSDSESAVSASGGAATSAYFPKCVVEGYTRPATSPVLANITVPLGQVPTCYCLKNLISAVTSSSIISGLSALLDGTDDVLCNSIARTYVVRNVLLVVSSIMVVIINIFLKRVLTVITRWEGHATVSGLHSAVAIKLFLTLFLNTGCLVLLINAALPSTLESLSISGTRLFDGQFTSFNARWHAVVGASLVLTMLINIISPHLATLIKLTLRLVSEACRAGPGAAPKSAVTQWELNRRFIPPDFSVPVRTAVTMNTLFVCLLYSAGHPILLPVAAASFLAAYWIDKVALLRLYRRPPMYDSGAAKLAVSLMPWAGVLHLCFSVWMYSEPSVLYSPQLFADTAEATAGSQAGPASVSLALVSATGAIASLLKDATSSDSTGLQIMTRISRENTLPVFLLLVLATGVLIVWRLAGRLLLSLAQRLVATVSLGLFCSTRKRKTGTKEGAPSVFASLFKAGTVSTVNLAAKGVDADAAARAAALRRARAANHDDSLRFNPPFCGPFAQLVDQLHPPTLTKYELAQGWRLVSDRRGFTVKVRVWPRAGVTGGLKHTAGQRMLTWEVIAMQGIASFDIAANPVYAPAVRAIEHGRWRRDVEAAKAAGMPASSVPGMRKIGGAAAASLAGLGFAGSGNGLSATTGGRELVTKRSRMSRDFHKSSRSRGSDATAESGGVGYGPYGDAAAMSMFGGGYGFMSFAVDPYAAEVDPSGWEGMGGGGMMPTFMPALDVLGVDSSMMACMGFDPYIPTAVGGGLDVSGAPGFALEGGEGGGDAAAAAASESAEGGGMPPTPYAPYVPLVMGGAPPEGGEAADFPPGYLESLMQSFALPFVLVDPSELQEAAPHEYADISGMPPTPAGLDATGEHEAIAFPPGGAGGVPGSAAGVSPGDYYGLMAAQQPWMYYGQGGYAAAYYGTGEVPGDGGGGGGAYGSTPFSKGLSKKSSWFGKSKAAGGAGSPGLASKPSFIGRFFGRGGEARVAPEVVVMDAASPAYGASGVGYVSPALMPSPTGAAPEPLQLDGMVGLTELGDASGRARTGSSVASTPFALAAPPAFSTPTTVEASLLADAGIALDAPNADVVAAMAIHEGPNGDILAAMQAQEAADAAAAAAPVAFLPMPVMVMMPGQEMPPAEQEYAGGMGLDALREEGEGDSSGDEDDEEEDEE